MTDTTEARARLEDFFRARSDDPGRVRVVDHQLITGGYSRLMSRVWVEDGGERRGYIVRQDPRRAERRCALQEFQPPVHRRALICG